MSLKNPVTPPGIDPGTVRLVAQRLNHYATPGPTNSYMLNIKSKLSSESDAKLTDKIEIKAFIIHLCLAGALRSNKKSLEELCGTDGCGIISLSGESQILHVPNPIHSRINYSLSIKLFTIF
jgi:hypothetical protein